jgi:hypothetical protein
MGLNEELEKIGRGVIKIPKPYLKKSQKTFLKELDYKELLLESSNKFYLVRTARTRTFIIDSRLNSIVRPAILDPVCVRKNDSPYAAAIFHYNIFNYILQKEKEEGV